MNTSEHQLNDYKNFDEAYYWEDEEKNYETFMTRFNIDHNGVIIENSITEDSFDITKGDSDLDINKDLIGFPTGPNSYTDYPKPSSNLDTKVLFIETILHLQKYEDSELFKGDVIYEIPERPSSCNDVFHDQNVIEK